MSGQITFNHKKSFDDYSLHLIDVDIGYPEKKEISVTVPYMNGNYDFSSVYGEDTYSNRQVKVKFALKSPYNKTRTLLNIQYDKVVDWLFSSGISDLKIDYVEYSFSAKVKAISSKTKFLNTESIEVTFECYPFRKPELFEGDDIWDEFNFELDVAQSVDFNVVGSKRISLINVGAIAVTPTVICDTNLEVIHNEITYKFTSGMTKDYRFKLNKGDNIITVIGTGNISFKFKKEVI